MLQGERGSSEKEEFLQHPSLQFWSAAVLWLPVRANVWRASLSSHAVSCMWSLAFWHVLCLQVAWICSA